MAVRPFATGAEHGSQVQRFKMTGTMGEKEIIKFATDVKEGNLEPIYKSAPLPKADMIKSEGVWMAVRDNFDSVVRDPTKDVLLNLADYMN